MANTATCRHVFPVLTSTVNAHLSDANVRCQLMKLDLLGGTAPPYIRMLLLVQASASRRDTADFSLKEKTAIFEQAVSSQTRAPGMRTAQAFPLLHLNHCLCIGEQQAQGTHRLCRLLDPVFQPPECIHASQAVQHQAMPSQSAQRIKSS